MPYKKTLIRTARPTRFAKEIAKQKIKEAILSAFVIEDV